MHSYVVQIYIYTYIPVPFPHQVSFRLFSVGYKGTQCSQWCLVSVGSSFSPTAAWTIKKLLYAYSVNHHHVLECLIAGIN